MNTQDARQWFADESFWIDFAPLMFDRERMKQTGGEVTGLLKLSKVGKKPISFLDTCCGMGRHALEMARRGHRVTGIDLTPYYLEQARLASDKEQLDIEWIEGNNLNFCWTETFNIAVNLYTSFGYSEDPEDDERLCTNILKSLKPGGCFVIETLSKEVASRDFQDKQEFFRDGYRIVLRQNFTENWTRMENAWLFEKNGIQRDFTFSHRIYSAEEIARLLLETGFDSVSFFGDFDGRLYNQQANTLLAIARKGKT